MMTREEEQEIADDSTLVMWVHLSGNIYNPDGTLNVPTFDRHQAQLATQYTDWKPVVVTCPPWAEETSYYCMRKDAARAALAQTEGE
jgi:hypothetical protein